MAVSLDLSSSIFLFERQRKKRANFSLEFCFSQLELENVPLDSYKTHTEARRGMVNANLVQR